MIEKCRRFNRVGWKALLDIGRMADRERGRAISSIALRRVEERAMDDVMRTVMVVMVALLDPSGVVGQR